MLFTPTQLAAHLACTHLTQLERQRRDGLLKVEFNADPRLEAMRERGRQHEQAFIDSLAAAGKSVRDLREERDPAATLAAMEAGFEVIVQATLRDSLFHGVADVLLRVPSSCSTLDGYSYEPADTKLSLETKAGTILQLCTYAELLASMQGAAPERIHVVTPATQETYRTAKFSAYHRLIRTRLQLAMDAVPPPDTYPHPVAHCDTCNFWRHCDQRRRQDDHPSLIAAIRTGQVREFQQQGMPTVASIAVRDGHLDTKPSRGSEETYRRLGHQARMQVLSRDTAIPVFEALSQEPGRGLARLPEPSIGDIFLDFEGDPFVPPHGLEYLTGVSTRRPDGEVNFIQHWALDSRSEKLAFEAFVDLAIERLGTWPDAHIYHFGAYEPSTLKRLSARHATRGAELDQLLRGRRFVDLHTVAREAFRIGVERYGLKELEPLHGFERRLELRDAALARRNLELALELGGGTAMLDEYRDAVARYNGDDCLSTESLRRWLEARRDEAVASGVGIARPVLGEMAPSEGVNAKDQRIAELREALLAGLPDDPEARSQDDRARALLAAMLGYYRQEAKNAWWEYFRLRDLPAEEHVDEREVLGGLEFVERLPKRPRERSARCLFRFAPQETAVDTGKGVVWSVTSPTGDEPTTYKSTVESFDFDARTVVLSISDKAGSALPSAVFRDPVVSAQALEDALFGMAEHVRNHGFDQQGPYAAAWQLLLAAPPRLAGGHTGTLRQPDEDLGTCLLRLCNDLDGGVLPVQGPPGAGKTTLGARAILALAAQGKRIGITAVSHKVIDNLLIAVRDADTADGGGIGVRLVHKDDDREPMAGIQFVKSNGEALGLVGPGTVVGGTAWLWAHPDAIGCLDVLVIDEAGQMALAQALAAARSSRNLLLLGDPQQLEQPTKGAHEDGADVAALVHMLGPSQATLRPDQGLFLDTTYRMHPAICQFTSEAYYEGRLLPAPGREIQQIGGSTVFAGSGLFLVEVEHQGNQAHSDEEVEVVTRVVRSLLQADTTWTDVRGQTRRLDKDDILVVAPYNAQVSALKRGLESFQVTRVGTVDKFQGQEAPVVIYSCTSSSPEDAPRGMSFLYDPHRFNVATSRARSTVIVVASPKLFDPDCRVPEQMSWANGFCRFAEMAARVSL